MDFVSPEKRSAIMRSVKQKHSKPEIVVRKFLHGHGYRFRLHRKDLAGKPDIVLPKHGVAVFVNGCFWHGHTCPKGKRPATNTAFWNAKLSKNLVRDKTNYEKLEAKGWRVVVIWECEIRYLEEHKLMEVLNSVSR